MIDEHPHVSGIYRYPVKGLTPERLEKARLERDETLEFDRAYAIENGKGRFDPAQPRYLPKVNFLMLMRNEKLASLRAAFDDHSHELTIFRDGKHVVKGALNTPLGRQLIEQFFAAYMADELRGAPHIVHAEGHSFSDVAAKCLHLVNLASVRELERIMGVAVDPLRFRANIYVDGLAPWREFELVGQRISIGNAKLNVTKRTERCEATNVDPETAQRDMSIPATLQRTFGHSDFGVYARIIEGAEIKTGDTIVCS